MYICFLSFQLSWFGTLDIDRIIYMYIYILRIERERESNGEVCCEVYVLEH